MISDEYYNAKFYDSRPLRKGREDNHFEVLDRSSRLSPFFSYLSYEFDKSPNNKISL
jgi:hypothetical protein